MKNNETWSCDCCGRDYHSATDVRQSITIILPHGVLNWFDACIGCAEKAEDAIKELFPKGKPKLTLWVSKLEEVAK